MYVIAVYYNMHSQLKFVFNLPENAMVSISIFVETQVNVVEKNIEFILTLKMVLLIHVTIEEKSHIIVSEMSIENKSHT